jgi:hypothetical protein
MKVRTRSISARETGNRSTRLRDALGNAALEGIKPGPEAVADLREVVAGTLSAEQYRQRVKARYAVQG